MRQGCTIPLSILRSFAGHEDFLAYSVGITWRRERKLLRSFRTRIHYLRSPSEIDRLMRDVELVASKSHQRQLGVGFHHTPAVRSRLEFEARKGWLLSAILYLDDRPCAFWIGSLRNHVYYSNYLGFDPEYSKYAPGMYLMIRAMQEWCDGSTSERVEIVDFGGGAAEYKHRLGTEQWQEAQIYLFAPSARGIWLNLLRSAAAGLTYLVGWVIKIVGLTNWIKRIAKRTASAAAV